jgi:hydroxyethylthiazole kinase
MIKEFYKLENILLEIKKQKPLIHHITNYVTANDCANIVLALGGSPIMAECIEEVEEIVSRASALLLNLGTLTEKAVQSMIIAGKKANILNIPVILDPVGVGASEFRRKMVEKILKEVKVSVIKGNLTEIKNISGLKEESKGVDSANSNFSYEEIVELAKRLAIKFACVVVVTGEIDIITDGKKIYNVKNGTPKLTQITGTGCMIGSIISICCGVTNDYLLASTLAILIMGISGEKACNGREGIDIGTFKVKLFDAINNFTKEDLARGRIYEG